MKYILEPFIFDAPALGNKIPRDIYNRHGRLILAKGQPITIEIRELINKKAVYILHVEWQDFQDTKETALLKGNIFRSCSPELYLCIVSWMQRICRDAQLIEPQRMIEAAGVVANLFKMIQANPKLNSYFNLFRSYDGYLFGHSVNVALLATLIGVEMGYQGSALQNIVLGAILHDIGKLMIPKEIINKPEALKEAEYDYIKRHPRLGEEVLKFANLPPEIIKAIVQHHECWNGTGYPVGLAGEEISTTAQIIAVADVFDATTTLRPYRLALPPYYAVELILNGAGNNFSPLVIKAFMKVLTLYPEDSLVKLNTGERGMAVAVPLKDITRPVVQILFDDKGRSVSGEKYIELEKDLTCYVCSQKYGGRVQMNIMLIDDDPDCMAGLASVIEPAGHSCEMFIAPEEAIKTYPTKPYDVVITDMKMPGMTGLEVLKAIKFINPEAKVIINTGYGDVETAMSAVNMGAYAFFGKPVDISELLETLDKINREIDGEKKVREEHARLAIEYARLKVAYEDIMSLLEQKGVERKRGTLDE